MENSMADLSKVDFDTIDQNAFITKNTREFEMFKKFLESQTSINDLLCWMDIEAYTRLDPNDRAKIEDHARMLKKRYFNKKYFFARDGPIDADTQNLVIYFMSIRLNNSCTHKILNYRLLFYLDIGENRRLERHSTRRATEFALHSSQETLGAKAEDSLDAHVLQLRILP
jgi:hypothetical protein